jgi:hypothetical protein
MASPVFFGALLSERLLDGPWPRPRGLIFDQSLVREGLWPGVRPALDQCRFWRDPNTSILGLKLVMSTTSVSPYQWPR